MYRVRTSITGYAAYPALSTMYFDEAGGTAQNAADAVRAFWAGFAGTLGNGNTAVVEADVARIDETDGALLGAISTTTTSVPFTGTGEPLPFATQGLIRWNTGVVLNRRFVRGRTFIPAFTESAQTAGSPISTIMTLMTTQATNLIANSTSTLVIWHQPVGAPPGFGQAVPAAGATAWEKWAVLRSRRD